MPNVNTLQSDFTSGVLDPAISAREDVRFYYNGLKTGKNVEILPQGGLRRRPGTRMLQKLKRQLSAVSLSGATVTAPQGGTAANAKDGDDATELVSVNAIGTTNPYVVAHVDFTTPTAVDFVDVVNYSLSAGSVAGEFRVQYSTDNSAWSDYDSALDIDASSRSRRRGGAVTARYWRFVRVGATNLGSAVAHLGEIRFWAQGASLSAARLIPFAYSTQESYMNVVSDRNMDVFAGADKVTQIGIPHVSAQLSILNFAQKFDLLTLYHPDVQPQQVFRQGSDDEFDIRPREYLNIPKFDFGAGTGGVDEVQLLNVSGVGTSDKFTILLEGERTALITGGASAAATATNIQAALRALPNTSATGITVTNVTDGYQVTFGGDDGDQPWELMSVSVQNGNTVWSTSRTTEGELPGEAIMSATRGWPRCGFFHDQREIIAGFKSLPDAVVCSKVGEPLNLDITEDLDDSALMFRPASKDQVGAIYQIAAARHLSFFANDSEFYVNGPLSKGVEIPSPTSTGSKEGLRVHEIAGALVYLQGHADEDAGTEKATSLQEFLFVDTEQNYQSNPISVLASHLIRNPVDGALRRRVNTDDTDVLFMANEDGSMAVLTTLRQQNVTAFSEHTLGGGGLFKAVGVDKKRRVYFVGAFEIDGETEHFVLLRDSNMLLDCGGRVLMDYETFTATEGQAVFTWAGLTPPAEEAVIVRINGGRLAPSEYSVDLGLSQVTLNEGAAAGDIVRIAEGQDQIGGLSDLEGAVFQTLIDGSPGTIDVTVTGGVLDIGFYADIEIQYGFDHGSEGELMPHRVDLPDGSSAFNTRRVIEAGLDLADTGHIEISANGGPFRDINLLNFDSEVLDVSMLDSLFTGQKRLYGLLGWSLPGALAWRQTVPAPLTIRGINRKVAL